MFKLDNTLQKDCHLISSLEFCDLLLMDNANFPWLILVPRKPDLVELTDLDFSDQVEILKEINLISQILQQKYNPDKINIAALGNVVKQLHIHVIARFENDVAFPKPVFAAAKAKKYDDQELQNITQELQELIAQKTSLKKEVLYRSYHRGCKETDHLIGNFAKSQIDELTQNELEVFKDLIVEDDLAIYDWILRKQQTPQKYLGLIAKMQKFHNV